VLVNLIKVLILVSYGLVEYMYDDHHLASNLQSTKSRREGRELHKFFLSFFSELITFDAPDNTK
jgi:hypothetical protein